MIEFTYDVENERKDGKEQCAEDLSDGLGRLLDELDSDGDPLPERDKDEHDDAEDDAKDDGKGEPRVGQLERVLAVVGGEVHLEDVSLRRRQVLHLDVLEEAEAKKAAEEDKDEAKRRPHHDASKEPDGTCKTF
jgi:hypothetical protein